MCDCQLSRKWGRCMWGGLGCDAWVTNPAGHTLSFGACFHAGKVVFMTTPHLEWGPFRLVHPPYWVSVFPGLSAHLYSKTQELSKVSFRWDRKYWSSDLVDIFGEESLLPSPVTSTSCWPNVCKYPTFIWLSEMLTRDTSTLYCFF